MQGHVDGTGEFVALDRIREPTTTGCAFVFPSELAPYVIFKGSLSIEGISLTVAQIEGTRLRSRSFRILWK